MISSIKNQNFDSIHFVIFLIPHYINFQTNFLKNVPSNPYFGFLNPFLHIFQALLTGNKNYQKGPKQQPILGLKLQEHIINFDTKTETFFVVAKDSY